MKGFPYSIGRGVALAFVVLFAAVAPAGAWDCHAVLTRATFVKEPLAKETVKVEPLEAFLAAEPQAVAKALDAAESRAAALLPQHRLRPASLAFDPAAGPNLRASFLRALRVNPEVPLALFLEPAPGAPRSGRPILAERKVSLVAATLAGGPFEALAPGDKVSALEVLVAASDEPGLWPRRGALRKQRHDLGEGVRLRRAALGQPRPFLRKPGALSHVLLQGGQNHRPSPLPSPSARTRPTAICSTRLSPASPSPPTIRTGGSDSPDGHSTTSRTWASLGTRG
jgi:hypothetical protein